MRQLLYFIRYQKDEAAPDSLASGAACLLVCGEAEFPAG